MENLFSSHQFVCSALIRHAGGVTVGEAALLIFYGEYVNSFSMWCLRFQIIATHPRSQVVVVKVQHNRNTTSRQTSSPV